MARLMFVLLAFGIVVGLLSMTSTVLSMREMTMSHQGKMDHESGGEIFTGSCCDQIVAFCVGCVFLVSQYVCNHLCGDSQLIINSKPIVQYIYAETITPPPKA